jgi:peptidoglycan/LPS O-acetylase OafA/YrhL
MSIKRIAEIDALRGFAAIAVLLYHYSHRLHIKYNLSIVSDQINFPLGHYGVELFFIISGFVIFMSVNEKTKPLTFLLKRALRLFPTYWFSMLTTLIVVFFAGNDIMQISASDFIYNITMLPSVFGAKAIDGVYWTLKIEWFFYITIFLVLLLNCLKHINYIMLIFSLFIMCLSAAFHVHKFFHYTALFISGMNFYLIWKGESKIINHFLVFSLIIISILSFNKELIYVSVSLVLLMYLLVYSKLVFLNVKPLLFLGKISFALYLVHQNIGHAIQLFLFDKGVQNVFVLLGTPMLVSLLLASFITYFIEIPTARFIKKRFLVKELSK